MGLGLWAFCSDIPPPLFFSFSSFPSPAWFPAKERLCSYAGRVSRLFGWNGAGDSGRGKA